MLNGVKETLCTHCAHRNVCAYKSDYLDIIKTVENASVIRDTPDGKITQKKVIDYDFIAEISVKCKHCLMSGISNGAAIRYSKEEDDGR